MLQVWLGLRCGFLRGGGDILVGDVTSMAIFDLDLAEAVFFLEQNNFPALG